MSLKQVVLLLGILVSAIGRVSAQETVEVFVADLQNAALRTTLQTHASAFLSEVNAGFRAKRDLRLNAAHSTPEFRSAVAALWKGERFRIPEPRIIETAALQRDGTYTLRNIPMNFIKPDGSEHYEEGVIQFTATGQLLDFRIGLASHRYTELLRQGKGDVDIANREHILQFIESFRTAYNRKDADYLNSVFSDQAVIIVGRVVQSTGQKSAFQQQVEYLQFTKDEYINRLRQIFRANSWIEVAFKDVSILRHPRYPEMYGVSLTQNYTSSLYSDTGYLFLLIDFRDREKPMIHVRTWQPTNATPEDQKFQLGDMEIY